MTDIPPIDDELLSAAIDGEVDADVRDRIEADPAAQARLHELRDAAAAVGQPVEPLTGDVVDGLIGSVLEVGDGSDGHGDDGVVVDLAARRARPGRWIAAAAAVVLVALAVPLALRDDRGGEAELSVAPATTEGLGEADAAEAPLLDSTDDAAASLAPEEGVSAGRSQDVSPATPLGDLGVLDPPLGPGAAIRARASLDDRDSEVAADVAGQPPSAAEVAPAQRFDAEQCLELVGGGSELVAVGHATVAGPPERAVAVLVLRRPDAPDGGLVTLVVAPDGCEVLDEAPLAP